MWSAMYKQTSAGTAAPCARENVVLTTRGNIQTCHSYWFYQYIYTDFVQECERVFAIVL